VTSNTVLQAACGDSRRYAAIRTARVFWIDRVRSALANSPSGSIPHSPRGVFHTRTLSSFPCSGSLSRVYGISDNYSSGGTRRRRRAETLGWAGASRMSCLFSLQRDSVLHGVMTTFHEVLHAADRALQSRTRWVRPCRRESAGFPFLFYPGTVQSAMVILLQREPVRVGCFNQHNPFSEEYST